MSGSMADAQREAVTEWSKEKARSLCHRASAFGTTSDHEYAEAVPTLIEELATKFPGVPVGLIQAVRYAMRLFNSADMDLAEVNRLRAERELPPLGRPGPIEHWPKFTPPISSEAVS